MMKSKYLKKVVAIIMVVAFGLMAVPHVILAADPEPIAYALNGTIGSLGTLINEVPWESSQINGAIKIQLRDPAEGAEFSSYKLLNVENDGGVLKVSVPGDAQAFWKAYCDTSDTVTVGMIKTKLAAVPGTDADKSNSIVNKFLTFGGAKPTPTPPTVVTGNVATINTEFGFYIIQQTKAPDNGYIASAPVLACLPMQKTAGGTWLSSYTAQPKDAKITVSKKVQAPDDPEHIKETIAEIGNTLEYKIVVDIAKYGSDITSPTYKIVDELPAGIEYKTGTAAVKFYKGSNPAYPTGTYQVDYDGGTRTLTLDLKPNYAYLAECDTVEITYQATLDSDAVIENVGNENEVTLTYTTDSTGTEGHISDTAKVYTLGLDITKIEKGAPLVHLPGATFQVYKNSADADDPNNAISFVKSGTEYRVATEAEITDGTGIVTAITVSDTGDMTIKGLNDQKYYFKETVAPVGYNLPSDLFEITVAPEAADYNAESKLDFDGNFLHKDIENDSGINLPVTGGMGTILFTAIGLLLMAGAAYFLFGKKKESH